MLSTIAEMCGNNRKYNSAFPLELPRLWPAWLKFVISFYQSEGLESDTYGFSSGRFHAKTKTSNEPAPEKGPRTTGKGPRRKFIPPGKQPIKIHCNFLPALLAIVSAGLFALQTDDQKNQYRITRGESFYIQVRFICTGGKKWGLTRYGPWNRERCNADSVILNNPVRIRSGFNFATVRDPWSACRMRLTAKVISADVHRFPRNERI